MAVSQTLSVTEVSGSVNTSANTSKVRILWKSTQSGNSWNGYTRTAKYYISINGGAETEYTVSYTLPQASTVTILDTTITVNHKGDGSGSVRVRTWMDTSISAGVVEKSQSINLTTIPRASSITSALDRSLGSACSVMWTPLSKSFRYKLKFSIGNWNYTTLPIHPNTTSPYTYTEYILSLDAANQIPKTTGTMTVALFTYSDSNATVQVGSSSPTTFTVTVPDNASTKPTVSMSLTPVNSLGSQFASIYIQGKSKVQANITASGKYSASITSYELYVDGFVAKSLQSDYLIRSGNITIKGRAYDSRGHYNEIEKVITVTPYSIPVLLPASGESSIICARSDANGNLTESGTHLKIKVKRSYSLCKSGGVQNNFCELRYRYKKATDDSYSAWVTLLGAKALTTDVVDTTQMNGTMVTTSSYIVQIGAIDDVGQQTYATFDIPTDKVYQHKAASINSLGLGKYAERENALDSDWDIYMNNHRITGLPTPQNSTDAVPKSYVDAANASIEKNIKALGWYKVGTLSGDMCGVATLTIGGVFMNNQASPSMIDVATHYNNARVILRLPSTVDNQIAKIGVIQESPTAYGVYAYYNSSYENPVKINIHTHMGTFASAGLAASSITESNMLAVENLRT